MSFLPNYENVFRSIVLSIQALSRMKITIHTHSYSSFDSMLSPNFLYKERAERTWKIPSFLRRRTAASLTLEASLALAFFLLFVISICYLFLVMQTQLRLQQALEQVGDEAAQYAYVSAQIDLWDSQSKLIGRVQDFLMDELSEEVLRLRFLAAAGEDWLDRSCVLGGASGISLEGDPLLDGEGRMRLVLSYRIRLPLAALGSFTFSVSQQSYRHAWVGDTGIIRKEGQEEETLVYVTEDSEVYHLTLGCSYLNLTVRQVPFSAVESLRNDSGARYYPCELCRPEGSGGAVYITQDGNRYHGDRQCGGISRSAEAIPLSQAGDRRPCSRCGGP